MDDIFDNYLDVVKTLNLKSKSADRNLIQRERKFIVNQSNVSVPQVVIAYPININLNIFCVGGTVFLFIHGLVPFGIVDNFLYNEQLIKKYSKIKAMNESNVDFYLNCSLKP